MNDLKDLIEITGNLIEEAWNSGRKEALKEVRADEWKARAEEAEAKLAKIMEFLEELDRRA